MDIFNEIEDQVVEFAAIKGMVCDSSVEEFERFVQDDYKERGLDTQECHFGRRSENSELHDSIHSSKDYWQEFMEKQENRERTNKARQEAQAKKIKEE